MGVIRLVTSNYRNLSIDSTVLFVTEVGQTEAVAGSREWRSGTASTVTAQLRPSTVQKVARCPNSACSTPSRGW